MDKPNQYVARLTTSPLLLCPHMLDLASSQLQSLQMIDKAEADSMSSAAFWFPADDYRSALRPYNVANGVLQIPVKGMLLNDFPWAAGSYATGYTYIQRAMERGMQDPEVKAIALVINSPGGEVAGNFDLVDKMYAMRGTKPIRAFAHENAYSAAYSIASVAESIVVSRTGGVGSIGVVTTHLDVSENMSKNGFKITYIYAGKHKVDGNPYEALSEGARAQYQSRIDQSYSIFVATVARNRGMDEQKVRDTEALCYTAEDALSNGLADSIGSLDDSLAAYVAEINLEDEGGPTMSVANKEAPAIEQATLEAATKIAHAEGVKSERARISAILALDESKGREGASQKIALTTDMSVEQAKSILAELPQTKPATSASAFDAVMTATGNPQVGAGVGSSQEPASPVEAIMADYRAATGMK